MQLTPSKMRQFNQNVREVRSIFLNIIDWSDEFNTLNAAAGLRLLDELQELMEEEQEAKSVCY